MSSVQRSSHFRRTVCSGRSAEGRRSLHATPVQHRMPNSPHRGARLVHLADSDRSQRRGRVPSLQCQKSTVPRRLEKRRAWLTMHRCCEIFLGPCWSGPKRDPCMQNRRRYSTSNCTRASRGGEVSWHDVDTQSRGGLCCKGTRTGLVCVQRATCSTD